MDSTTIYIIIFFIVSSVLGHLLLHRVCKTRAEYYRPVSEGRWIDPVLNS
jgi:hypothetical protein